MRLIIIQKIKDFLYNNCNNEFIININDFNCKILRHSKACIEKAKLFLFRTTALKKKNVVLFFNGVYKNNLHQINPHASKEECKKLLETDLIYGCAGPLKIIKENEEYKLVICDYI